MKPTILPTAQVSVEATVLPFKVVTTAPASGRSSDRDLTAVEEALQLLDRTRAQIADGKIIPRHLAIMVVEDVISAPGASEREKSFMLTTPTLGLMELVGNLFAIATALTEG